jgi:predicted TIM-barrel fold metal-dependent hydrolase
LPIVEPHHHLWTRPVHNYLISEFLADIDRLNVRATVFIECHEKYRPDGDPAFRPVGETEFITGLAQSRAGSGAQTRFCAGIVGNADLMLGDGVKAVLEAHIAAGDSRFRGVRNISAWHSDPTARGSLASPPPGLVADAGFRRGFACLAPLELTFDAYMYHTQLSELADLARAFPETSIVVNHSGGPLGIGPYQNKRCEVFDDWAARMSELAACPNINVKIGGLGLRAFGLRLHEAALPPSSQQLADEWKPYIETCIDKFGTSRCMFESNFPVDKGTCGYTVLWNAFKRATANYSAEERASLFSETASQFYRLSAA